MIQISFTTAIIGVLTASALHAEWAFNSEPTPMAYYQNDIASIELQCDRIRFAPPNFEISQRIFETQEMSLSFLNEAGQATAFFQVGPVNSSIRMADNFPVEIEFVANEDLAFVWEQTAQGQKLEFSEIGSDISFATFDLSGSARAIKSLSAVCPAQGTFTNVTRTKEDATYCGGDGVKREISFEILDEPVTEWDALITVNGATTRAMTAYSYFGNAKPPANFIVALLGEDRSEVLVYGNGSKGWLEYGDYRYDECQ